MTKGLVALPILIVAVLLGLPASLSAADLSVETLQLLSHGVYDPASSLFSVNTRLFFDLALKGGDKFSGLLRMDFLSADIEKALALANSEPDGTPPEDLAAKLNNLISPAFKTASITASSIFGSPIDATYFVGYMDDFASGDDFGLLFGATPFGTTLRGPMVYPEGVGGTIANPSRIYYEGIHVANGTGFRFGTNARFSPNLLTYLYLYQDADTQAKGRWSADFRLLLNYTGFKMEFFSGASTDPASHFGIYRGGVMLFGAPGEVGEFFVQVGVPHWDPASSFDISNLYVLFEPRLNLGFGSIAITVFYHPTWYRQQDYSSTEKGSIDAALNLRFGSISKDGAQGGTEVLFKFRQLSPTTPLTIDASPYYSLIWGGVQWDFKLGIRAYPVPSVWYGIFQPYIGLKTSF